MSDLKCEVCGKALSEDHHSDESGDYCWPCYEAAMKQSALDAGIPLSVIEGKTKLSDHFSKEYIEYRCGRTPEETE
jgi:hypothetical protein